LSFDQLDFNQSVEETDKIEPVSDAKNEDTTTKKKANADTKLEENQNESQKNL